MTRRATRSVWLLAAALLTLFVAVSRLAAQQSTSGDSATTPSARAPRRSPGDIPFAIAVEMAELYNGPVALRATGPTTIAAGQDVGGDIAVANGPLDIAGHVSGRVIAIDADVTLHRGARVDGAMYVIGGTLDSTRAGAAAVGGRVVVRSGFMNFHFEADTLVADRDRTLTSEIEWIRRWKRRFERSRTRLELRSGPYDRVEGLPVIVGPLIRRNADWGHLRLEVLGIYRSADEFAWKAANLGYDARIAMGLGASERVTVGVEARDVVSPVEDWQLRDAEVGLASFFLHRDYRDYFTRHGARGFISFRGTRSVRLTLSYGRDRWDAITARDPFTLFRNHSPWRRNPLLDQGTFRVLGATVTIDTRNAVTDPASGWYVVASLEHGSSSRVIEGPSSGLDRATAPGVVPVRYTRGVVDAHWYNRVSPGGRLDLRLYLGGQLGSDPLPLERRFSLGGVGTLPGYDFRQITGGADVLTCGGGAVVPGTPAECERVAFGQAELRNDFTIRLFPRHHEHDGTTRYGIDHAAAWVIFADAGRGWLVGRRLGDLRYASSALPSPGTLKTDMGGGVDFGLLGVYVAKSLTDWANHPRFFVRLRQRF